MSQPEVAKINRKHTQRSILLVVVGVVVLGAVYWVLQVQKDPDPGKYESLGNIAAIMKKGKGSEAVILKPDGSVVESPGYVDGAFDQNVTWRPDGQRLFFDSDRYNGESHVFRWNPARNAVERKTIDRRDKGTISFSLPGSSQGSKTALVIAGGTVLELNPDTSESTQLIPPSKKSMTDTPGEEGAKGGLETLYAPYGVSFRKAEWTKDRQFVVGVLKRESGGECLIIQDMVHKGARPQPVATADHIGFDLNPVSGLLVFSMLGSQIPEWDAEALAAATKNGKVVPPFKHGLFVLDPLTPKAGYLLQDRSQQDQRAYGDPVWSPDGKSFALSTGQFVKGGFQPTQLLLVGLETGQRPSVKPLIQGPLARLSWNPTSTLILALARAQDGHRHIFTVDVASGSVTDISKDKGDFEEAQFSPQTAK